MNTHSPAVRFATVLATAGAIAFSSPAPSAQYTGNPTAYAEAWVDPVNGSDATGTVDAPSLPFLTLESAMTAVGFDSSGRAKLVHAMPGVYSPSTNGEPFPIVPARRVNVQGHGARQCVIRGTGQTNRNVVWPSSSGYTFRSKEVLLDLSTSGPNFGPDNEVEMFDGFTFQGGDVQVYTFLEENRRYTISNCVFDMLPGSGGSGGTPTFGALTLRFIGNSSDITAFDIEANFLHNTFVMWQRSPKLPGGTKSATDAVGICNTSFPDNAVANRTGWSNLSVLNNLFYLDPELPTSTAMLGVNAASTEVGGVPTNAAPSAALFDNTSFDADPEFGTFPSSAVDLDSVIRAADPPFFVGELVDAAFPAFFSSPSRDWRLLHDSVVRDAGVAPTGWPGAGLLVADNGTTYVEPGFGGLTALSSTDWDSEYYGNIRVEDGIPDIGADELGLIIDVGAPNDSITTTTGVGVGGHLLIYPAPGETYVTATFGALAPGGYTIFPGLIDPPIPAGVGVQSYYLDSSPPPGFTFLIQPKAPVAGLPGTGTPFGYQVVAGVNGGGVTNLQTFYHPTGGAWAFSNLQSRFD